MDKLLIKIFKLYQKYISPNKSSGNSCIYFPTCSSYGIKSVEVHGWYKGGLMAIKRILSCHPGNEGGHDYVPGTKLEDYID